MLFYDNLGIAFLNTERAFHICVGLFPSIYMNSPMPINYRCLHSMFKHNMRLIRLICIFHTFNLLLTDLDKNVSTFLALRYCIREKLGKNRAFPRLSVTFTHKVRKNKQRVISELLTSILIAWQPMTHIIRRLPIFLRLQNLNRKFLSTNQKSVSLMFH